jgi:thiol-disulfide isomerase/thioredoxin
MLPGLVALAVVVLAATVFGLVWQRRSGRVRAVDAVERLTEADLGAPVGARATLVQFTTAFCAPCRATRVILGQAAELVDGVAYAEVDAESNLDLVRRLDIRRTPTVLVLDASGRIAQRASGQPRKSEVLAALANVIDAPEGPQSRTPPAVDHVEAGPGWREPDHRPYAGQ